MDKKSAKVFVSKLRKDVARLGRLGVSKYPACCFIADEICCSKTTVLGYYNNGYEWRFDNEKRHATKKLLYVPEHFYTFETDKGGSIALASIKYYLERNDKALKTKEVMNA